MKRALVAISLIFLTIVYASAQSAEWRLSGFIDGNPGRDIVVEFQKEGADWTFWSRCYLVKNRLFLVSVSAKGKYQGASKAIENFLNSFRLTSD